MCPAQDDNMNESCQRGWKQTAERLISRPALRWAERTSRVPADVVDRFDQVPSDDDDDGCKPMLSRSMSNNRDLLLRSTETTIITPAVIIMVTPSTSCTYNMVLKWLGRRTCDQQVASSTAGCALMVSTGMGDRLWMGKPSRYVTAIRSHRSTRLSNLLG